MPDQPSEASPEGGPGSAPQPESPPKADSGAESQPGAPADSAEVAEAGPNDPDGSGDDAAPLTAEALAGEIRLRRQMRLAGIENLGGPWFSGTTRFGGPASFGGHAAARDVNVYYGTAERTALETGPIDPELLSRIDIVHVAGASCAAALQKLGKQRLVVLRGAKSSGKRTTALAMLKGLAGDNLHSVSADQVLGTQAGSGLTEHAGHIAESLVTKELTYTRLAALSADLGRLGAYLVITTPVETVTDADVEERFVVDHEPPDGQEVILSHLRLDAGHADAAERLMRDSSAADCATTPGAAAELAAHLLRAVREGLPAEHLHAALADMRRDRAWHLLRVDRPDRPRERVELLCRRAALVSIAVFTGLPHADAMAAAESLAARFVAIEFPGVKEEGREIFIPWRDHLRKEPDIIFEEPDLPSPWGSVRVPRVRFTDVELNAAVLEVVWEQYETTRSPLLGWLHELGVSSRDEAIRVRAAQIAGRLAARDFGHVYHRLLVGWANSINKRAWEAAATALEAASATMASHVWELLSQWCDHGNVHQQRIAVLALGTRIGEKRPDEVLDQLRRLALRNTAQDMGETVRRSVTELFSGPHPGAVLRALRAWTESKDPWLRALAARCIPPLAYVTGESEDPFLLRIMAREPAALGDAAATIGAALDDADTRQETWTALEKLTAAIVPSPELTSVLGTLLADLTRLSSTADIQLRFYMRLWAHRHPELRQETGTTTREANYGR
jgi:hypothetical protein